MELQAWHVFKWICLNFLENFKSPSYQEDVAELLVAYKRASHVFAKHFLYLHLEFFPENLGAVSDEHDKKFYQDIQAMKESYQGV